MLVIEIPDRLSVADYLLLVKPGMRQFVREAGEADGILVLGASFWGEPVGAIVVSYGEDAARLLDLYVLPDYRRAGIGRGLFSAAEEQVAGRGIAHLQATYRRDEQTPIFERLLLAQGWSPPSLRSSVFWTQCAVGVGPWVSRYRFRPPYEIFLWADLTDTERTRVGERGEAGWYPPIFSPFYRPDAAWDAQSSVGLRCNGEVVGWCLTVREKPDQMLVDSLFVDPPLQRLGRGFMLVGEVIRRYCAGGGDYAYWRVSPENELMLRWSRKAFAGEALVDQYEEWYSEKILLQ